MKRPVWAAFTWHRGQVPGSRSAGGVLYDDHVLERGHASGPEFLFSRNRLNGRGQSGTLFGVSRMYRHAVEFASADHRRDASHRHFERVCRVRDEG